MNLEHVKLCPTGTEALKALIEHVSDCVACQRELALTIKAFPFAALMLGTNPIESLKKLKGTNGNG